MSGALVRGAVAIFLTGALAACSTNGPAVTGPETSSVALDMRVNRVACKPGVQATACFKVTITNLGSASGDGSCRLFGETHRTSYPGDESKGGQVFKVKALGPGQSVSTPGAWLGSPRDSYRGICNPELSL